MSKPLWIPLKTEYFLAFERGEKTTEYRLYGGPWREHTCWVGRETVLGLGYSGRRLRAVVTGFEAKVMETQIYGQATHALIHLRVLGPLEPAAAALPRTGSLFPT